MIEIKNISISYGKKQVLQDISFTIPAGQQVAIIGRNGCGKTTLMQILAGIITPNSGEISYFQKDMRNNRKLFSKYCGYLPQENPLMEELTVQDNISLWTGKFGKPEEQLIRMFELQDILKTTVSKLSGGMKRRVSIACAVAQWPPILLMDEPTTALDMYYKESIRTWMKEYRKMNGILLFTTHDKEEIESADSCMRMKEGRIEVVEQ